MKSILIANSNHMEIDKIGKTISQNYKVLAVTTPKDVDGLLDKCDTILLDHNFTQKSGIDFLKDVLDKSYLPVLMVTPPDDSKCAIEALRMGAHNYLVKTANYYELLDVSIKEALEKFNEREEMKETIITLKKRVVELEERIGTHGNEASEQSIEGSKTSLIQEITSRFKRGEINLPSYPEINIKFQELMNQGANVTQIASLLKKDIGISSKLISLSNSPFYRGITENKTLEQAISRMGLTETRKYVSIISNRALYMTNNSTYTDLLKKLWEHSLSCAYASEILSEIIKLKMPDEVFTMGLFHDIGKLMLLQIVAELESGGAFEYGVDKRELFKILNEYHGNFGGALLKKWRFPKEYPNISLYHHKLKEADPISKELLVVNLANIIVKTMGYGQEQPEKTDIENTDSFRFLKMTDTKIAVVKDHINEMMQNVTLI